MYFFSIESNFSITCNSYTETAELIRSGFFEKNIFRNIKKECVHCAKMEYGPECIPEAVKYRWDVNSDGKVVSKGKKS